MTVSGPTSSTANQFLHSPSDSLVGNVSERIAVLVLETQETRKEVERELLDGARHDFSKALSAEVEALRDQADAEFRGAIFEGATTIVGGGLGVWSAETECPRNWQDPASKGLLGLAKPLAAAVGNNYGAADAKSAQGAGEQAEWEVEELRGNITDAWDAQDKALDWSARLLESDAATTSAILSNMA